MEHANERNVAMLVGAGCWLLGWWLLGWWQGAGRGERGACRRCLVWCGAANWDALCILQLKIMPPTPALVSTQLLLGAGPVCGALLPCADEAQPGRRALRGAGGGEGSPAGRDAGAEGSPAGGDAG